MKKQNYKLSKLNSIYKNVSEETWEDLEIFFNT